MFGELSLAGGAQLCLPVLIISNYTIYIMDQTGLYKGGFLLSMDYTQKPFKNIKVRRARRLLLGPEP